MADQNTASQAIPVRVLIVDTNGVPVAGGVASAVTIANGGDFAEGSVSDVAWVSGDGTVIALLKKIASAGGSAVTIADGADVAEGALADAAIITDTTGTLSGKIRGLVKWAFERMPASLGQATSAASLPVVLPAAQITTLTPPAAITGFALDATLTGRTAKTQITDGTRDGTVKAASTLPALTDTAVVTTQRDPLPAGTNVVGHVIIDSGSTTVVSGTSTVAGGKTNNNAAPGATNVGALGAVANAADQSWTEGNLVGLSTDLAGFLRSKVSSWLGSTAPTVGSKTSANSLPVVVASDQASIPTAATLAAETTKVIGTVRNIGNAGANFDAATAAAVPANGLYMGGSDGTNLRGILTTSAANLTAATTLAAPLTPPFATWSITHRPAAATKATASKGAGAAGVRHVVTGFSYTLSTVGTAQAALLNIDIIDGASGGTTRLWSGSIGGLPINSQHTFGLTGLMLIGTAATALTIEFSAAGATASVEQVNLWGFSVS